MALTGRGLDLTTLWREASAIIAPVVPNMGPCWYTLDPASLLITSHFNEDMPVIPPEMLAAEYYDDDVNQLADVARSPAGVSTLHDATGGDPTSSPRWHSNMELGGDQELVAALRTPAGDAWGGIGLYRESGQRRFSPEDLAFVRAIAPALGEGARRALLLGEATDPEGPEAPGLVVLGADWEVESATPGVERWLSDLPGGDWDGGACRRPCSASRGARCAPRTGATPPGRSRVARVLAQLGPLGRAARRHARGRRPARASRSSSSRRTRHGSPRCSCRPTGSRTASRR